jgi:small GTP-binding protein
MQPIADGGPSVHKLVLLGDSRVGKTSIISRKTLGYQPATQKPTIGCHWSEVRVAVDSAEVTLQVWDTAGQEMYRALVPVYLRGARAALLVYDISDRGSFESLGHWHGVLADVAPAGFAAFVVANKIDLDNDAVDDAEGRRFAAACDAAFFRVSAVTGAGLDALFEAVARGITDGAPVQLLPAPLGPAPGGHTGCDC